MSVPQSECHKCKKPIHWHKSKAGKNYPCDSEDRRDFHKCAPSTAPIGANEKKSDKSFKSSSTPIGVVGTPDFEPTLEERVATLEKQLVLLTRTVQAVQARQPIDDSDLGF